MLLSVQNVGRGAAYYIDAGLDLGKHVVPAAPWTPGDTEPQNLAVLAVREAITLYFAHIDQRPAECSLVIDYEDLTGRAYATSISIRELQSWDEQQYTILHMDRVQLHDDRELIPWKPSQNRLRRILNRLDE